MTLDQWTEKYDGYVANHSNGCRYVPGCHYLAKQAYKALWVLTDFHVSSVSGGVVWLTLK